MSNVVVLCSAPDCPRTASYGPYCVAHRGRHETPPGAVAVELTDEELDIIRDQVEADAAPLFLIAMQFIAAQEVSRFTAPALNAIGVGE